MMITETVSSDEATLDDNSSAFYFSRCRAKKGFGAERRRLIEDLRSNENLMIHAAILCFRSNSSPSNSKNEKWYEELVDEKKKIVKRLREISGKFVDNAKDK